MIKYGETGSAEFENRFFFKSYRVRYAYKLIQVLHRIVVMMTARWTDAATNRVVLFCSQFVNDDRIAYSRMQAFSLDTGKRLIHSIDIEPNVR